MCWKKLPDWIKGGIIGIIVYFCIGIFSWLAVSEYVGYFGLIGGYIEGGLSAVLSHIYLQSHLILAFKEIIIYAIIPWFIAGALVGLIIQLIKKMRNKQNTDKTTVPSH